MADGALPPKQTKDGSAKSNNAKVNFKDNQKKLSESSDKKEENVNEVPHNSQSKNSNEFLHNSYVIKNQNDKWIRENFELEKPLVQELFCENNVKGKLLKFTHCNDPVDQKDWPKDIIEDPKVNTFPNNSFLNSEVNNKLITPVLSANRTSTGVYKEEIINKSKHLSQIPHSILSPQNYTFFKSELYTLDNSATSSNNESSKENVSVRRNFIKENINNVRDTKVKFRFGKQAELKNKDNSVAKMQHTRNDKTQVDKMKCLSKSPEIFQVAKNYKAFTEAASRSAKNSVSNSFAVKLQISTPISRADIKYMTFSPKGFSDSSMSDTLERNLDANFQMAGLKILSALGLKVWRKRSHEIKSIKQKLKYSELTQMETENRLEVMTEWYTSKTERNDKLQEYITFHLRETKYVIDEVIKNIKVTRSRYENIKIQLCLKDQQCEQLNDMLTETMSKIFNSMKKRRELDMLLTTQQRSNQMMRWEKEDYTEKAQKELDQLKLEHKNLKLQLSSKEKQYLNKKNYQFLQMISVEDKINSENDKLSASIELLETAIDNLKYECDQLKNRRSESKIKTALNNLRKIPIGYLLFTGIFRLFWGTEIWSR